MDLTKILKDCPKGTILYSTIVGCVRFVGIDENATYCIAVNAIKTGGEVHFTKQGMEYSDCPDAECVLFPSKENRDWNTFKVPIKKFNIKELKPFDKVLVRDSNNDCWRCGLFSHYCTTSSFFKFICICSSYMQCIPYNDETKHLIGINDTPSEKYINW